jgi:hypothetical protein
MAMEHERQKVACGMATANLFQGGQPVRRSLAVTVGRRQPSAALLCRAEHQNGSARIEPRTAFSPGKVVRMQAR